MEDIFLDMLRSQHEVTDYGYSITVMDVEGKKLIRPTFQYTPHGHESLIVQAQEATLHFDLDKQQVILHLVRGHVDTPGQDRVYVEEEDVPFPLPPLVGSPKPRNLSIRDISRDIEERTASIEQWLEQRDAETSMSLAVGQFDRFQEPDFQSYDRNIDYAQGKLHKLHTEIHSRFALSCSCFFFALLGGPFAILRPRKQFLTNFFVCFLPILGLYYPIVLLTMNLSKYGTVEPAYTMWLGNLLLLIVAVPILRKVLRH